jgi:hypothetical protein
MKETTRAVPSTRGTSSPRRQRPGFDRPRPQAAAGGGERGGKGAGVKIRVPPAATRGREGGGGLTGPLVILKPCSIFWKGQISDSEELY